MRAETVLVEAVESCRFAFGKRVLAVYALGSLAHGGFSELVSDIDLGLVVSDPLFPGDAAMIQVVVKGERSKGSLHERLSVFWGTPSTLQGEQEGGRFPALDRLDLIEHGRLLAGSDGVRDRLRRPDTGELVVAGAQFALDSLAGVRRGGGLPADDVASPRPASGDAIEEIRSPDLLVARGVRRLTKLVLFPVRFLYTAATGRVGINDDAVAYYLRDEMAPSKPLAAAALAWRTEAPADGAAAAALLREQMRPLYLHYIADHIARLDLLGEIELANGFKDWRDRLLAARGQPEHSLP